MEESLLEELFVLEPLVKKDESLAAEMAATAFVEREPLCIGKLNIDDMLRFTSQLTDGLAEEGLSFVVRERRTGRIVSGVIAEDVARPRPLNTDGLHPVLHHRFEMLDQLSQEYLQPSLHDHHLLQKQKRSGMSITTACAGLHYKAYHFFLGWTVKEYEGKGLGKFLRTKVARMAKAKGFNFLYVNTTNPITASIWCNHVGGKVMKSMKPCEFRSSVNGAMPWQHLNPDFAINFVQCDLRDDESLMIETIE